MQLSDLNIRVCNTTSGQLALLLEYENRTIWLTGKDAATSPRELITLLAKRGLHFTGKDDLPLLTKKVAEALPYSGPPPIDQPGWAFPHFAMADGSVFSSRRDTKPVTTYQPNHTLFKSRGRLEAWHDDVAPIIDQPLPLVVTLLSLLAVFRPLLRPTTDLIVELVVPNQTDLDAVRALVGSVTGGSTTSSHLHGEPVYNALSRHSNRNFYNDQLILLFDAALSFADESPAARANDIRGLMSHEFRVSCGGSNRPRVILMIGYEPFGTLINKNSDLGRLVTERIITLEIVPQRQHGIFDFIPVNLQTASDLSRHLQDVARRHHGRVLRKFIGYLVRKPSREKGMMIELAYKRAAIFKRRCDISPVNTATVNLVDAFAFLHAVGLLAKDANVFPATWPIGDTLVACLSRFVAPTPSPLIFDDELRQLLASPDALHVGNGCDEVADEDISAAELIISHRKNYVEVVIRPEAIGRRMTAFHQRKTDTQVVSRWKRDGRHEGVRRSFIANKERIYCFRLPRSEAFR